MGFLVSPSTMPVFSAATRDRLALRGLDTATPWRASNDAPRGAAGPGRLEHADKSHAAEYWATPDDITVRHPMAHRLGLSAPTDRSAH